MDATAEMNSTLGEVRPLLLKLARLQLRSDALAEDVVSETMVAALEQSSLFQARSKLRTWIIGILKHKIIDQLRRQMREVSIEAQIESGEIGSVEDLYDDAGALARPPQNWGDPEAVHTNTEFMRVLEACIDRLPSNTGRAFMMREWLEYETPDICRILGITRANCNVMLFRARMRLRECVEAGWLGRPSDCCAGANAARA